MAGSLLSWFLELILGHSLCQQSSETALDTLPPGTPSWASYKQAWDRRSWAALKVGYGINGYFITSFRNSHVEMDVREAPGLVQAGTREGLSK